MDATREALKDAIELAEEGWGYVDTYFREKWEFAERVAALRSVLSQEPGGAPPVCTGSLTLPVDWTPDASGTGGSGLCGICQQRIPMGHAGVLVTHPYRPAPSPSPGEPGGAPSSPLVRSKEWWLRQADSEGPEDFDCTAGVPGPTTAERAAHWQQGAAAAYREQGMEHAASWYRARRLFSGMDTPAPAPLPSPGAPRIAPLCCPPEPTEHSECPHERTEAGWCAVCGEDVSGSPSPGEAPRELNSAERERISALLDAHERVVLLCEPPGCSQAEYDEAAGRMIHARDLMVAALRSAASPSAESDLKALQRKCDEATPGPWDIVSQEGDDVSIEPNVLWIGDVSDVDPADLEFICAARTALPNLIAELRALRRAGGQP